MRYDRSANEAGELIMTGLCLILAAVLIPGQIRGPKQSHCHVYLARTDKVISSSRTNHQEFHNASTATASFAQNLKDPFRLLSSLAPAHPRPSPWPGLARIGIFCTYLVA
jgi:hypothetical protein